jgi:hypothetical protein
MRFSAFLFAFFNFAKAHCFLAFLALLNYTTVIKMGKEKDIPVTGHGGP